MDMIRVRPYTGDDKYIFISYAHKDSALVYPIIQNLAGEGYHIWYDEGIDPGTEWDEEIAAHVEGCDSFIAFISNNYLASDNCKDELNFARDLSKERLLVYLEDVKLPSGMAMRLNRLQAIHKYTYGNEADFFRKLQDAAMLARSKGEKPSMAKMLSRENMNFSADSSPVSTQSSNSPSDTPCEHHIDDPYILGSKISEGGVATVYEATHTKLMLPVVVKFYKSGYVEKSPFWTDSSLRDIIMQLDHPNISSILDYQAGANPYTVEKLIHGYSLRQVLASQRPTFDYPFALEIVIQILSALEVLHKKNLYHGDVSVDNIMLEFSNDAVPRLKTPYLIDFSETNYNGYRFPNETICCGHEQSPERTPGGVLDFRSDIYEIGIVLEKLIHKCIDSSRTFYSLHSTIDIYDTKIFSIIKKATCTSPSDRYKSAAAMRKEVEEVLQLFPNPN